nr:AT-hook motif nuclear-localized protein 27-like [Tanacetum cinerariifolium]
MSYSSDHQNNNNLDEHDHSSGPIRRTRGRPPGSKNKPRQPVFVTRDNPNALRSHVLEVCDGADIVESLAKFAKSKGRAVSVLSGTGVVADVTLRQPADPPSDVVTLYGRFQILTITGMGLVTFPSRNYCLSFFLVCPPLEY